MQKQGKGHVELGKKLGGKVGREGDGRRLGAALGAGMTAA